MRNYKIILLLVAGLVVRLMLFDVGRTLDLDLNTFVAWGRNINNLGPSVFYNSWSDYLPGYLYVLWFLSSVEKSISIAPQLLFKLPAILGDLATGLLIYKIVSEKGKKKLGYWASAFYIFNPAVIYNSTFWGQVDGLTAFFSLLAIYLLDKRNKLSAIVLAIATLVKPQAAIAALVVLIQMLHKKWRMQKISKYILLSGFVFMLAFIPFAKKNLFSFIVERVSTTLSQYPYTSVNAFNFWGVTGFWIDDTLLTQLAGYLLFATTYLFVIKRKIKDQYLVLAILFAANFLFFTRMHERHLLPALAPLVVAATRKPKLWAAYVLFSITYVLNMEYSYQWVSDNFSEIFSSFNIAVLVAFNIFAFAIMLGFRMKIRKKIKKISISKSNSKAILALILTFALLTRIISINYPTREYFDEVYHAFTARAMLNGDPKAWEWWNESPEGFAYEWTHPPLAKEIMVVGMAVLGENPIGWRAPGVIAGTSVIFLIYLITKKLFEDEATALLAAALMSLEGLSLVMSRIGMNDIYFLLFMLLAFYFFIKQKNIFASISYGLALASKWSALWFTPILTVTHFALKRKFTKTHLAFLFIPVLVYVASYIPFFTSGHTFKQFINLDLIVRCNILRYTNCDTTFGVQQQMWWYHTNLQADHAYSSPWWSWPLMERPDWHFVERTKTTVSNIYIMGNPIVFWFGAISIGVLSVYSYLEKNKKYGLIIFSYLAFFVPWAASPRLMFFYHYLPSVPFMIIAAAIVLRRNTKLIIPILLLSFISFIYFYPHMTGLPIPIWLDETYYWISSWR